MKEKKITVLVEKVDVERYRELKREGIYPLIVETDFLDIFEAKPYYKDGNLYKLKIEFLKERLWKRTCQNKDFIFDNDIMELNDRTRFNVFAYLLDIESPNKEEGVVLSTELGNDFVSMEELYNRALGINSDISFKEAEDVTIVTRVASLTEYENMKKNNTLPLVIVLTEFQSRVISLPFDGLYIKTSLDKDNKEVFVLELRMLKKKINEESMRLVGIKFKNGEVHKVDNMYGGDYNSLGSFTVGNRKEEVAELIKKLLENKEPDTIKLRKELTTDQTEQYYVPNDTFF